MDSIKRNKNYFKYVEFKKKHPKSAKCLGHELLVRLSSSTCSFRTANDDYYFDKRSEPTELNRAGNQRKHHFIVFNFNIKRRGIRVREDVEMDEDDSAFLVNVDEANHLELFWSEMLRAQLVDFDLFN